MPEQEVIVKEVPPLRGMGTREVVGSTEEIGGLLGDGFAGLGMAGKRPAGPPAVVYHDPEFDPTRIDVEVVYPVAGGGSAPIATPGGRKLEHVEIAGGTVASLIHAGPYETLGDSYQAIGTWIEEHGYRISGPAQEVYLSGPDDPPPPVTEIRMPISPR